MKLRLQSTWAEAVRRNIVMGISVSVTAAGVASAQTIAIVQPSGSSAGFVQPYAPASGPQVTPDPKFAASAIVSSPGPRTGIQPVPAAGVASVAVAALPLGAPVQVALAAKYANEPTIDVTRTGPVAGPYLIPGSAKPTRVPFQPSTFAFPSGPPLANSTYRPDVVNEPTVDTSHPPVQLPVH